MFLSKKKFSCTVLNYKYFGSTPCDYVPTLDIDAFAIINTEPSNMQGDYWILIAIFRHEYFFADSLWCKGYSFLNNNNQHYKQMMPALLQSHLSVCGFRTIYAAFHLFKFPEEEITGVYDINVFFIWVIICIFSVFVCKCAVYFMFLSIFIHSN